MNLLVLDLDETLIYATEITLDREADIQVEHFAVYLRPGLERFLALGKLKLKRKGYRLENVVMLDDTPAKLAQHYGNLVRAKAFFGDPEDRELFLLAQYLPTLAQEANVRILEKRYWRSSIFLMRLILDFHRVTVGFRMR